MPVSIEGFSSQNSLHEYAKVGLAPTGRGYAGNIVLCDIIVQGLFGYFQSIWIGGD
jgi:hypothetical protein